MKANFPRLLATLSLPLALASFSPGSLAEEPATAEHKGGVRAMAVEIEAVVTHVDVETRTVTLRGPQGNAVTLGVPEDGADLTKVMEGDHLRATYIAALEGELREPTEEEAAEPWVVLEDTGRGEVDGNEVVGGARLIRAVCTIEGMNRLLGTITLLDPNGRAHVVGDVEPEKMSGVELGQTVVVIYREALALSLEHMHKDADAATEGDSEG